MPDGEVPTNLGPRMMLSTVSMGCGAGLDAGCWAAGQDEAVRAKMRTIANLRMCVTLTGTIETVFRENPAKPGR
jgi:hypothetical protein